MTTNPSKSIINQADSNGNMLINKSQLGQIGYSNQGTVKIIKMMNNNQINIGRVAYCQQKQVQNPSFRTHVKAPQFPKQLNREVKYDNRSMNAS